MNDLPREKLIENLKKLQAEFLRLSEEDRLKKLNSLWGSIYIIRCQNHIKIGRAFNVKSRLYSMKVGNPFDIELIFSIKVPDDKAIEKELHNKFENKHHKGEWFNLTDEDVEQVKEICKKYAET